MGFFSKLPRGSSSTSATRASAVRAEVLRIVSSFQVHRREKPFQPHEAALGNAAFFLWRALAHGMSTEEQQFHFHAPNESARQMAVSFVEVFLVNPAAVAELRQQVPSFDPARELVWARLKGNDAAWRVSLTRAIIIICRALAYAFTGIMGDTFAMPPDMDGQEYKWVTLEWIRDAGMPGLAVAMDRHLRR